MLAALFSQHFQPSNGEERLINRAGSSEWTVIRGCLIASIARQSRFRIGERSLRTSLDGSLSRGIKRLGIYNAMEN